MGNIKAYYSPSFGTLTSHSPRSGLGERSIPDVITVQLSGASHTQDLRSPDGISTRRGKKS